MWSQGLRARERGAQGVNSALEEEMKRDDEVVMSLQINKQWCVCVCVLVHVCAQEEENTCFTCSLY